MPRTRANGDGGIIQRKDGRYEIRITIDGKRRTVGYSRSKTEANAIRKQAIRDRDEGRLVARSSQTLAQFLKHWLEDVKRPNLAKSSFRNYDNHCARFVPIIGAIPLGKLTSQDIRSCYTTLDKKYSRKTIANLHTMLKEALQYAEDEELILKSPARKIRTPRLERRPFNVFSLDEVQRIIRETKDDPFHALWVLYLTTGMRRGEALGLTWERVHSDYVLIEQTAKQIPGGGLELGPTKTAESRRRVDIPPSASMALEEHRQRQRAQSGRIVSRDMPNLVFPNQTGGILGAQVSRFWKRTLMGLGIPHHTIHDCRHTFATLLSEKGAHMQHLQGALGHADAETTMKNYLHLSPTSRRQVASQIEEMIR
jgi:integrase